jgi:chemosensory pili system protein ChpA (sensor histidine kinase/response regulator)
LQDVAAQCDVLKLPALAGLLRQCADVAQQAVVSGRSAALEQEIGTALLFAETGLEQVRRLPDDFAGNAETIAARLQALLAGEAPPASAGELSRQIEQGQTVAALADDMKTGCARSSDCSTTTTPMERARARRCGTGAAAIAGATGRAGQDDASAAVRRSKRQCGSCRTARHRPSAGRDRAECQRAGFFVDMLGRNAQAAKGRFHFDAPPAPSARCRSRKWPPPVRYPCRAGPCLAPVAPSAGEVARAADGCGDARHLHRRGARRAGLCRQTLALPREQAASGERLAMLRRSFHTLKGSRGSAGAVCRGGRCHRARHEYLAGRGAPGQR